jgi:hypothetical protein
MLAANCASFECTVSAALCADAAATKGSLTIWEKQQASRPCEQLLAQVCSFALSPDASVLLKNEANMILPISSCQLFRNGILDLNQIKSPRAQTIVQIVQALLRSSRSGGWRLSNKELGASLRKRGSSWGRWWGWGLSVFK